MESTGIVVGKQYYLRVVIESKGGEDRYENFIDHELFESLVLIEESRNVLPSMKIVFGVDNTKINKYLNQGNIVKISFGTEFGSCVDSQFVIVSPLMSPWGSNLYKVSIVGIYDTVSYLSTERIQSYSKQKSVDVIRKVFGRLQYADRFRLDFDLDTDDEQVWIQPSITDKAFVNQVIMAMNVKPGSSTIRSTQSSNTGTQIEHSFPVMGITSSGVVRMKDFRSWVTDKIGKPVWIFTSMVPVSGRKNNEITHEHDIEDISNAAMLNAWRGNGMRIAAYDTTVGGIPVDFEGFVRPGILSGFTAGADRDETAPLIISPVNYLSGNMHRHYWEAKARNLQGLAMYSSKRLRFSSCDEYRDVKVLDIVSLRNPAAQDPDSGGSGYQRPGALDTSTSGTYIVSKVARNITKDLFSTVYEVSREGSAEMVGSLGTYPEEEEE